jgi:glycosyltransferase involved in cell wall biosynthesis
MNVVIAAMSAPTKMNGVSRHGANLVRALLSTTAVSCVHFIAGEWQKEMFCSSLAGLDARLHTHWIALREANLSRLFWYYRELPCIAEQLQADIVHLTFPAPTAQSAYHCPVVLSLHDLYPFEIPRNFGILKSMVARHTVDQCIRRVNAVACVSTSTQRALSDRFPALTRKSVVIPNVVEFPSAASSIGIDPLKGRSFILCVAQHRSNKNIPLVVEVFEQLMRDGTLSVESRLVIVGIPGPETPKIQEAIHRARLSCKVLLYTGLSEAEMRWCFENCEVLLAPSTNEGFGLPIIEGLLAGARAVCSDIPAFREIAGGACHFVPWTAHPVATYAHAVRQALTGPRTCGARFPRFSAAAVGRQYAQLYSDLIRSPMSDLDPLRREELFNQAPVTARFNC